MGIKQKLEDLAILGSIKETFTARKKLFIVVGVVVIVLVVGVLSLAMLGQNGERQGKTSFTPAIVSTPVKENNDNDMVSVPGNASEQEIETAAQNIMSEIEMLTAKQEQIALKMENVKRKLDISNDAIENKKLEIDNLNKNTK